MGGGSPDSILVISALAHPQSSAPRRIGFEVICSCVRLFLPVPHATQWSSTPFASKFKMDRNGTGASNSSSVCHRSAKALFPLPVLLCSMHFWLCLKCLLECWCTRIRISANYPIEARPLRYELLPPSRRKQQDVAKNHWRGAVPS